MARLKGTDRSIARLMGETMHNLREEMEAQGHKVHHYSHTIEGWNETCYFADGWRIEVSANTGRHPRIQAMIWWEETPVRCNPETGERNSGMEHRSIADGPSHYRIGFDGTRRVYCDETRGFRAMTKAENDAWDEKRKARRSQLVKPFSTLEAA